MQANVVMISLHPIWCRPILIYKYRLSCPCGCRLCWQPGDIYGSFRSPFRLLLVLPSIAYRGEVRFVLCPSLASRHVVVHALSSTHGYILYRFPFEGCQSSHLLRYPQFL